MEPSSSLLALLLLLLLLPLLHTSPILIPPPHHNLGPLQSSNLAVVAPPPPHPDLNALLRFKNQIQHDHSGALNGWGRDGSPSSDPCSWRGVACGSTPPKRVVKLELVDAGLAGPLALSALASLEMLQSLDLSGNAFYGNLSGLRMNGIKARCAGSLQSIKLSRNLLTGLILADFLICGSIRQLDLSHNNISGSLSEELFSSCGSLQSLDLSHNHLTGSLPSGMGQCTSLQQLNLSSNSLSGELPRGLLSASNGQRLETLDLSFNNLSGHIPDVIFSSCGALISIDLSSNGFSGEIPASIGECIALQMLDFSGNELESHLPASLGRLGKLKRFYLSHNQIVGPIPPELGSLCSTLQELDLSSNNLTGGIPSSFGDCSSLQKLNLANNDLSGSIPGEVVGHLQSLEILILALNRFNGSLPVASMNNCTKLKVLDVSSNTLLGPIRQEICSPTSLLKELLLQNNQFSGEVPVSLSNCSQLMVLDLSFNHLRGSIPVEWSSLYRLDTLSMWLNGMTGPIPQRFGGLTKIRNLILNNNFLSGGIPVELSNCSSLEWLSLSSNRLVGSIPPDIGKMQQLTLLELANNSFSGVLPVELGNCTNLLWLDANSNSLSGVIPARIGRHASGPPANRTLAGDVLVWVRNMASSCRGMGNLLEVSGISEAALRATSIRKSCQSTMLYSGHILQDDPDFSSLQFLDLSYNLLEGSIPEEMGYSRALQIVSLAHNQLTGSIPASFSYLKNLGLMDLSYNKLEGGLWPLANCSWLVKFDLSNNNFSGTIPQMGQLNTAPASVYLNNPLLCGTPLPSCGSNFSKESNCSDSCVPRNQLSILSWSNSIVMGILISVACVCVIIVWTIIVRARSKEKIAVKDNMLLVNLPSSCNGCGSPQLIRVREPLSINVATFQRPLRKLGFPQLVEAANGFCKESLIGVGGFGEVYKAELKDGSVIAIKKLVHSSFQGDREFMAEMETLGKIKHRNLVPLLGYCKVGEERLLVYEYMHGGSLEDVLHGRNETRERPNWERRKRIAMGAARGLAFLHHECVPRIIHRDMKSSNVLLDKRLEACVSDFGLARLISALDTHLSVTTLAGTPGYVPPEYYQSFGRCTTKGDVYSFGVILLELITGKRPTEEGCYKLGGGGDEEEDGNLVGWVKRNVAARRSMEVIDKGLVTEMGSEEEMLRYLEIACQCVEDAPSLRPTMLHVVQRFKELV